MQNYLYEKLRMDSSDDSCEKVDNSLGSFRTEVVTLKIIKVIIVSPNEKHSRVPWREFNERMIDFLEKLTIM